MAGNVRNGVPSKARFGTHGDILAGALVAAVGAFAAYQGREYGVGTLTRTGPGFFPAVLGISILLLGLVLIAQGKHASAADLQPSVAFELRGWTCILAGMGAFMLLGTYAGLVPATFACVFVAALGDRGATLKTSVVLASVVSLLAVVLFSMILDVQMPVFW